MGSDGVDGHRHAPLAGLPSGPSQDRARSPHRRSLAAPLTQGSQSQPTVVSEKVNSQVEEHIAAAQALFQQAEFAKALLECDRALAIDPRNGQARWLRDQISKTHDTLQGKAH
jgi:hypothetical protein